MLKPCRVCGRNSQEADPVNEDAFISWGYAADSIIDEAGVETVSGKQDWYCQKNNEINHNRRGEKALGELYEGNATFRDQWELDRDSIIAMAAKC